MVEVEDAPVAFNEPSALCYFWKNSRFLQGSPGHLPAPFALSQGLGGDTAAMLRRSEDYRAPQTLDLYTIRQTRRIVLTICLSRHAWIGWMWGKVT